MEKENIKNPILRFIIGLSTYEKWYLFLALAISTICACIYPEEDVNGINGGIILTLLLIYTWLNVICELLISKQDKWNFIVSLFIEVCEIAMYWILGYRFATMAITLFFWIPIDIFSFVVWKKHPDREEKQKTVVRQLSGWQRIAVIGGVLVWTALVGKLIVYLTGALSETTDIFDGREAVVAVIVCYLDAMVSALDICNGTFILLRIREQWIAWYLEVIIDAVCVILSGQLTLLVLTAAYLTNTTYGFIRWGRYIKTHEE